MFFGIGLLREDFQEAISQIVAEESLKQLFLRVFVPSWLN
jgi:hypothetical protein